jgi:hypothetical protein
LSRPGHFGTLQPNVTHRENPAAAGILAAGRITINAMEQGRFPHHRSDGPRKPGAMRLIEE